MILKYFSSIHGSLGPGLYFLDLSVLGPSFPGFSFPNFEGLSFLSLSFMGLSFPNFGGLSFLGLKSWVQQVVHEFSCRRCRRYFWPNLTFLPLE